MTIGILFIVGLLFGLIYLQRRLRQTQDQLEQRQQELLQIEQLREQTSQVLSQRGLQQQHIHAQLRTAVDVMESGPTDLEPHAFLQNMAQRVHHHFNFYVVSIFELDPQKTTLVPVAHANRDERIVPFLENSIPLEHAHSVVARAGRTREPAVVNNIHLHQDSFMPHHLFPLTRSELALPLIVNDTLLGVLDVQDVRPNRFYTSDVDTFTALARHIATNLEKSRLLEQQRQKYHEAEMLSELTTAVNESLDITAVLDTAATKIVNLIPAVTHCGIGLFDPDLTQLTLCAEYPTHETIGLVFWPQDTFTVRDIIQKRQPIVINDTSGTAIPSAIRQHFIKLDIRSIMIVPIVAQGHLLGSIGLDVTGDTYHTFTEDEIALSRNVANQIGGAILRARLLQEAADAQRTAEEASNTRSAFLTNMRHDLLTPLNTIVGYSELILDELAPEKTPIHKHYTADIQHIHDAGRHLQTLLNDLIEYARLDIDPPPTLLLSHFDLTPLAHALAQQVKPRLATKGNQLHLYLPETPAPVLADKEKVSKIILYLLENAHQFTKDGHIILRLERDSDHAQTHWKLTVQDTGVGLTHSQLGYLFKPLQRPPTTSTTTATAVLPNEPHRLGMALAERYCHLMGGEIQADSTPREGTTISVRLPQEVPPTPTTAVVLNNPETPNTPVPRPLRQHPELLIIEDDPSNRNLLARSLQTTEYVVHTVQHGREALAHLEQLDPQHLPDLILLDLLMPEMNGFQFLNNLYNTEAWRHIPIIVVTAKDLSQDERLFLHQRVQKILRKGHYSLSYLLQAVGDLLPPPHGRGTQ
ncbi:MAG: GAF domain-containing protein [Anaerolineales bacterium]|nr:GAF domain-containing protein [Anaerolineales bacterium]